MSKLCDESQASSAGDEPILEPRSHKPAVNRDSVKAAILSHTRSSQRQTATNSMQPHVVHTINMREDNGIIESSLLRLASCVDSRETVNVVFL